jgi:hypothetical protein
LATHHPHWFRENEASVHAVGSAEFLKPLPNAACLRRFASDSMRAVCNHKFMQLTATGRVRDVAFLRQA